MGELTTDPTAGGGTTAPAATAAATVGHGPGHHAIGCPECFEELQRNRDWWKARPEGSRLVGLVVARDDMPSVVEQRNDLARFGVAILDFKHPAPEGTMTWEQRFGLLFETLRAGDVLVVANERALGATLRGGRAHHPHPRTAQPRGEGAEPRRTAPGAGLDLDSPHARRVPADR